MTVLTQLSNLIRSSDRVLFLSKLFTAVFFPLIEAFLVNLATSDKSQSNVFIVALIPIVLVHFLLAIFLLLETPVPSNLIKQLDDDRLNLAESNAELRRVEKIAVAYDQAISAACASIVQAEDMSRSPAPNLSEVCEKILEPWIASRSEIFLFELGDALYNFAVYQIEESREFLRLAYRSHDERLSPTNRRWQVGDGHVGTCFLRRERMFLTIPSEGELIDALRTTQPRSEDSKYYRSMVASPIWVDQNVEGVLIVTSSVSNQFIEAIHWNVIDLMALQLGHAFKNC